MTATYIITATFKITGRGLVLAGYINEGIVYLGDYIEFSALGKKWRRKIIGIEGIRKANPDKSNTGLLIKCENEREIDELRAWTPDNETGVITHTVVGAAQEGGISMSEELIAYILRYYSNFMREDERLGFRFLETDLNSQANNDLKALVCDLLKDGSDSFRSATAQRILKDNAEKIKLNFCPKCNGLARTPTAQQCRYCGHQWQV